MPNNELSPELLDNIRRAAKIGACADLLSEIAIENDLDPQTCSAMVIALANQKFYKAKGVTSLEQKG